MTRSEVPWLLFSGAVAALFAAVMQLSIADERLARSRDLAVAQGNALEACERRLDDCVDRVVGKCDAVLNKIREEGY